jgi:hypothetical protein
VFLQFLNRCWISIYKEHEFNCTQRGGEGRLEVWRGPLFESRVNAVVEVHYIVVHLFSSWRTLQITVVNFFVGFSARNNTYDSLSFDYRHLRGHFF